MVAAVCVYLAYSAVTAASSVQRVSFWICALVAAAIATRVFLAGVVIRTDGIRVCAILWSRTIPWSDIGGFSAKQQWIWDTPRSLVIELVNGRQLSSPAISFQTLGEERAVLRELTEARRKAAVGDHE